MAKQAKTPQIPTHDEIAACARRIYEAEGRPEGKAMEHWLQAEAQLLAERKSPPAATPAPKAVARVTAASSQPLVRR